MGCLGPGSSPPMAIDRTLKARHCHVGPTTPLEDESLGNHFFGFLVRWLHSTSPTLARPPWSRFGQYPWLSYLWSCVASCVVGSWNMQCMWSVATGSSPQIIRLPRMRGSRNAHSSQTSTWGMPSWGKSLIVTMWVLRLPSASTTPQNLANYAIIVFTLYFCPVKPNTISQQDHNFTSLCKTSCIRSQQSHI